MTQSSILAHNSIKPHKEIHYKIILKTMKELGKPASSQTISDNCDKLDRHAIARRLSEMRNMDLIYVSGIDTNTKKKPLLWELK